MRYLELLIDRARELSQNTRYDADSGISQRVFTQYFQNAQDFIVKAIINSKSKYFLYTQSQSANDLVSVVNGQELYSYPTDIILQGIDTLEWTQDLSTWIFLEKCIQKDRVTSVNGYPYGYLLNRANVVLTPPLDFGYLRFTYNKKPKRLEKRSGKVTVVTGTPITSITIDTTVEEYDPTYLNKFQYITIVGKDGVSKVAAIPITGVSGGTITVSSYTLASGESIAVGDFVLAGPSTTNLPQYDDLLESFLILHATYQAKYGDSSQWTQATKDDVKDQFEGVMAAFATLAEDVSHIPITNTDYLYIF